MLHHHFKVIGSASLKGKGGSAGNSICLLLVNPLQRPPTNHGADVDSEFLPQATASVSSRTINMLAFTWVIVIPHFVFFIFQPQREQIGTS